jgi:amino acid transporter
LATILPRLSDSMVFLPVLLYNALGFELMSAAGDEMKNPQRDVPRVVLLSGLLIALAYALAILGILLAVPLQKLSLVTGTWDALAALGAAWGTAGDTLVLLLGLGFLYACIANIVTWSLGVNRVAATAAGDGALPAFLGTLHPRLGTPYVAFIVMGGLATLLLIGNALLASDDANVFWMLFKLSGLCFLFSYLLAFPAFLQLRLAKPGAPRPYRVPGGAPLAALLAGTCFSLIALACVLFFQPSLGADPARAARETLLLGGECAVTIAVGLLFAARATRSRGAAAA